MFKRFEVHVPYSIQLQVDSSDKGSIINHLGVAGVGFHLCIFFSQRPPVATFTSHEDGRPPNPLTRAPREGERP